MQRHSIEHSIARRFKYLLVIIGVLLLMGCSGICLAAPHVETRGSVFVGDWVVFWGTKGAAARNLVTNERVRLYRNVDESGGDDGTPYHSVHESGQVLSVVGAVVSYIFEYDCEGGNHPYYGRRVHAVDLEDHGRPADIAQIFDDADVTRALADNETIRAAIGDASPSSLRELVTALGEPCEVDYRSLPGSFWVQRLEGKVATVVFGLGHGCEVARGAYQELEIRIPVPPEGQQLLRESEEAWALGVNLDQ